MTHSEIISALDEAHRAMLPSADFTMKLPDDPFREARLNLFEARQALSREWYPEVWAEDES